jgi:hypothetical protein
MSIRQSLQKQLRRSGFFDSGRLLDLTADGGDVGTADRAFPRTAVPVAASDSNSIGNDNLFLVSQEHDMPAPAGLWPFVV